MNNEVDYKIAKLLFDKGFNEFCSCAIGIEYKDVISIPFEYGVRQTKYVKYGVLCNSRMDEFNSDYISCPTIAEVVMWLYEKHGFWIEIKKNFLFNKFIPILKNPNIKLVCENTPIEAYESAIIYILNNFINDIIMYNCKCGKVIKITINKYNKGNTARADCKCGAEFHIN